MKVSLVVVHYHAADLAVAAARSFRRQAAEAAVDAEVVVVDHGSDAAEARVLAEAFAGEVVADSSNPGFAAGVNRGVAATDGEVILVANPDLELFPGALSALLDALADDAGVAGPRFYWDAERRFLLPPTELRGRSQELLTRQAPRSAGWARRARRAWRRHARRHWRAEEPLLSYELSGALLALRRPVWHRVGPFDEGYRLYFEEVDWLRRCQRSEVRAVYQPRAEVLHHYNRSAAGEPRAGDWFAASAERFDQRWYGPTFRAARRWLTPAERPVEGLPTLPAGRPRLSGVDLAGLAGRPGGFASGVPGGEVWVEISSLVRGFPAAAERWTLAGAEDAGWELPEAVWRSMDPGLWRLTVSDPRGRERGAVGFEVPPREPR